MRMMVAGLVLMGSAMVSSSAAQSVAAEGPKMSFDVVSIRENKARPTTPSFSMPVYGPTANGYQAKNMPLILPLLTAYVPTSGPTFFTQDQVTGMPDWSLQERYDVDAKISEADEAEWKKPESQAVMLRAMLQAAFAERCKLVVHRETKELSVLLLEVSKGGPKFKETDPAAEKPAGMTLPSGDGVLVPGASGLQLYGVSMGSLATLLASMPSIRQTVIDKTGLTGRYDLMLKINSGLGGDAGGPSISVDDLGLKMQPGKSVVEKLVVDHMERPSAN